MKYTSLTGWTRVLKAKRGVIIDLNCMSAEVADFKDGRRVWLEVTPEVAADLRAKLERL